MINNDPDYTRSEAELQAFLIYGVAVAGKSAKSTLPRIQEFLQPCEDGTVTPWDMIGMLQQDGMLRERLEECHVGMYGRMMKFLSVVAHKRPNLRECSVQDLEALPGVGPKTARFFIMFNRPKQRLACLDTHILTYLREKGHDAPKSTPANPKKYAKLEKAWLDACDQEGRDPAEFDYEEWKKRAEAPKKRRRKNATD